VPGPRGQGGEWERVATALATAGGKLEAATAALVTRHKHGPNLVDVRCAAVHPPDVQRLTTPRRLPPGTAALATVGVADALRWMRGALLVLDVVSTCYSPCVSHLLGAAEMYAESEAALEEATRPVRLALLSRLALLGRVLTSLLCCCLAGGAAAACRRGCA